MMTLNHGFSGYVCGRAAMPLLRRITPVPEGALALAFFVGAMLPDIDAVGNLIGPGVYFADAWYGHRQITHSILGTWLLALAAAAPLAARQAGRAGLSWRRAYPPLVLAFWAGGLLHIVGDLFTPRRPMPVLWPYPAEFGAYSHIGWFSPFLLWLFLAVLAAEAVLRRLPGRAAGAPLARASAFSWRGAAIWGVQAFAAARWIDYLARSRYLSPAQWTAYQHSLLPDALVGPLDAGVHALWVWMVH